MSNHDLAQLRALTLLDNVEWLRSFGCVVHEADGMLDVRHANLPDYTACLVIERTPASMQRLRRAAAAEETAIYVDAEIVDAGVQRIVSSWKPISRNLTVTARVTSQQQATTVEMREARIADAPDWSAMYSAGFGRSGADAEIDRWRWTLAFRSAHVQHWFFTRGGERVGVCQTTSGEVTGIYSLTLLPSARGALAIRNVLRALFTRISMRGRSSVYFETLRKSLSVRSHARSPFGKRVLRSMIGYAPRRRGGPHV